MAARLQREDSRCVLATSKSRRSSAADDNRQLTDEIENGMNAADSVMKAAGKGTNVDVLPSNTLMRERPRCARDERDQIRDEADARGTVESTWRSARYTVWR